MKILSDGASDVELGYIQDAVLAECCNIYAFDTRKYTDVLDGVVDCYMLWLSACVLKAGGEVIDECKTSDEFVKVRPNKPKILMRLYSQLTELVPEIADDALASECAQLDRANVRLADSRYRSQDHEELVSRFTGRDMYALYNGIVRCNP